jgi:hypothetical protein
MPNNTCVLTQPRFRSASDALHACFAACDLTDVHMALGCLHTLLARNRTPDEDDADVCDGGGAAIRLINESLVRRDQAAFDALQAMSQFVERELAE